MLQPLRKILIANRGEIAVRIVRACAEARIKSVAIYADADRHALHVKKADEAYNIGPDSVAGYLNVHRIVNLAKATGCDALHPRLRLSVRESGIGAGVRRAWHTLYRTIGGDYRQNGRQDRSACRYAGRRGAGNSGQ